MLETIDLSKSMDRATYKEWFPQLQDELSLLQRTAYETGLPTVVVFEGWEAAGKGDSIMMLLNRLDPRGFKVHKIVPPTDEERLRPFLWRYWQKLPPRGGIAIFDGSWYSRVLAERAEGLIKRREWQQAYQEINQFERQLVDDGHVIVKFFLHITKKEQKKRFQQMEASPVEAWRVTAEDWKRHKAYDEHLGYTEEMLERTSTSSAPWTIVEATDRRYRRVKVFQTVIQAMRDGLERRTRQDDIVKEEKAAYKEELAARLAKVRAAAEAAKAAREAAAAEAPGAAEGAEGAAEAEAPVAVRVSDPEPAKIPTILDRADLALAMDKDTYDVELDKAQARLRDLGFECYRARTPVMIGYEGWDAAGKGGNIKRLTERLDPRGYDVIPIAAPKGDEATHHYLWRFWRAVPKAGHIAIFDRTWYGRLLVERVEGFCARDEWRRAFQEINEFEQSLVNYGTVVVKFWLHVSKEEQLQRFEGRQQDPDKTYKITEEDWRNREKWDLYEEAVVEMLERTSTSYAPWTIVEGQDKYWARMRAITTVVAAIEDGLKRKGNGG